MMHPTCASSGAFAILRRQMMLLALLGSAVWVWHICLTRAIERDFQTQRAQENQAMTAYCCRSAVRLSRALLGDKTVVDSESIIKNGTHLDSAVVIQPSDKSVSIKSVQSGNVDKMGFLPITVQATSGGKSCALRFKYGVKHVRNEYVPAVPVALAVAMDRLN